MLARDLMTRNVACCTPDTSVRAAAQLMRDEECGCLPVMAGDGAPGLVGLVTDRDLVCRALVDDLNPAMTPVSGMMSSPVATVTEDATADDCLQRMAAQQVRRLVVVDHHGRCCGIIAQGDIARKLPAQRTGDLVREVSQPDKARRRAPLAGSTAGAGVAGIRW